MLGEMVAAPVPEHYLVLEVSLLTETVYLPCSCSGGISPGLSLPSLSPERVCARVDKHVPGSLAPGGPVGRCGA